jgi:ABC-type branched-subunit amino acid transport system ATPase component
MILKLKDISLSFAKGKDSFRVLDGLSLDVPRGKITALIGGNGAGKTTLFNIISGFQKPDAGEIRFAPVVSRHCECSEAISSIAPSDSIVSNNAIGKLPPHRRAQSGIGRLFQSKGLFPDLTLLENMLIADSDTSGETPFVSLFRPKRVAQAENNKRLKAVAILNDLFGADNKYVSQLDAPGSDFSFGEQRLLALACLCMGDYSLLLLDEPTSGMNPVNIENIRHIIRRIVADGSKTVLLIEHNITFVSHIADRCAFLEDGKIALYGSTEEVFANKDVINSYMGITN